VEEKQRLGETGAIAVEMEAAAVAAYAEECCTPFYCIRVVSDAVDDALPLDLNEYRTEDGDFDRRAIALAALRRPFRRIPALRRLQRNCQIASETLGAFLADCRF
jgi:adenosylhomocysteine nucleosidase